MDDGVAKNKSILQVKIKEWLLFSIVAVLTTAALIVNGLILKELFIENETQFDQFEAEGDWMNPYPSQNIDEILESMRGRIPILEYHLIESPYVYSNYILKGRLKKNAKTARYYITSAEFREHLETLYKANFRNISLNEYLSLVKGQKKELNRLPPETHLYVLTFDDSTCGQFDFIGTNSKNEPIIDPNCAVGIMIQFAKEHPDFKLNAAFSVTFDKPPFLQTEYIGKKLNLLLDYGFEIVNHTKSHSSLSRLIPGKPEKASYELGKAMELFESYLGYRAASIDKVCYPNGRVNPKVWDFIKTVHYNNRTYHFTAALDAVGLSAKNPNESMFNVYNIARIEINSDSFKKFVVKAPNLYKTPSLSQKIADKAAIYSQIEENKSNTLDLIRLK